MFRPSEQLQLRLDHRGNIYNRQNQPLVFMWSPVTLTLGIHALELIDCPNIIHLGDLKTLKSMTGKSCTNLVSVGQMDSVIFLSLWDVRPNLLCRFSLETMEQLFLVDNYVLELRSFRSLKKLSLKWHSLGTPVDLPFLGYTSLETLELQGLTSFDVTGLVNLKSLNMPRMTKLLLSEKRSCFLFYPDYALAVTNICTF
jgi:hypothetical protein